MRRLANSRPGGSKDREYLPQTRRPTEFRQGKSREGEHPPQTRRLMAKEELRVVKIIEQGENRAMAAKNKDAIDIRYASPEESRIID